MTIMQGVSPSLNDRIDFREFDHVFLCRSNEISDIAIAAEDGMLEGGFLLYVHQNTTAEAELFAQIGQWVDIEGCTRITDAQACRVLYCTAWQK